MLSIAFAASYFFALILLADRLSEDSLLIKLSVAFYIQLSYLCVGMGLCTLLGLSIPSLLLPFALNLALAVLLLKTRAPRTALRSVRMLADRSDVAAWVVTISLIAFVALTEYGAQLVPNFLVVDPATHYRLSREIVETGLVSHMYLTHYFSAMWMMVFEPLIGEFYCYKVFIACELVLLAASVMTAYSLAKHGADSGSAKVGAVVLVAFYLLGYPVNASVVYGFSYLEAGVGIVGSAIWLVSRTERLDHPHPDALSCFALTMVLCGISMSYSLYTPVLYLAVGIWALRRLAACGRPAPSIAAMLIALFALPLLISYFSVFRDIFANLSVQDAIATDGSTYKNLFGNFVFIVPASIYGMMSCWKSRSHRFALMLGLLYLLYSIALFALCCMNRVSAYYFFKMMNLLWLFALVYASWGVQALLRADRNAAVAYLSTWFVVFALAVSGVDERLSSARPLLNPEPESWSFFDIYKSNRDALLMDRMTEDELELFNVYADMVSGDDANKAIVIDHPNSASWFCALTGIDAQSNYYWNYSDDEFRRLVSESECTLVVTHWLSKQAPVSTKDGTSASAVVDTYSNIGERLYANNAGVIIDGTAS